MVDARIQDSNTLDFASSNAGQTGNVIPLD